MVSIYEYKPLGELKILCFDDMTDEWLESQKNNPAAEIKGDYIYLYELTKTGKRKVKFEKLGTLSEYCAYFYDYNF